MKMKVYNVPFTVPRTSKKYKAFGAIKILHPSFLTTLMGQGAAPEKVNVRSVPFPAPRVGGIGLFAHEVGGGVRGAVGFGRIIAVGWGAGGALGWGVGGALGWGAVGVAVAAEVCAVALTWAVAVASARSVAIWLFLTSRIPTPPTIINSARQTNRMALP